jgi:hypothetical protein
LLTLVFASAIAPSPSADPPNGAGAK